jgi:hypothetical protein
MLTKDLASLEWQERAIMEGLLGNAKFVDEANGCAMVQVDKREEVKMVLLRA